MTHNPIVAWSYSRLSCYEDCPRLFKFRTIDKLDEPKGAPMMRGLKIHRDAAAFLDGTTDVVPESCQNFADLFIQLKTLHPIVEQKWAFTEKMKPTTWMAKNCWLRVTLDVGLIYDDGWAEVIDHKTGKKYDGYEDQLNLFAHAMISLNPIEVTKGVVARNWYLDIDDDRENEVIREITRPEALAAFDDLAARAEVMMTTTRFPASPSWKCSFCHFRRDNGGPCEF